MDGDIRGIFMGKVIWYMRLALATLVLLSMSIWFVKPPSTDVFEIVGAVGGRVLIAYLLIRKW